jgi:hypothetical protein
MRDKSIQEPGCFPQKPGSLKPAVPSPRNLRGSLRLCREGARVRSNRQHAALIKSAPSTGISAKAITRNDPKHTGNIHLGSKPEKNYAKISANSANSACAERHGLLIALFLMQLGNTGEQNMTRKSTMTISLAHASSVPPPCPSWIPTRERGWPGELSRCPAFTLKTANPLYSRCESTVIPMDRMHTNESRFPISFVDPLINNGRPRSAAGNLEAASGAELLIGYPLDVGPPFSIPAALARPDFAVKVKAI